MFIDVEIPYKTLNLGPVMVDLILNAASENKEPQLYLADETRDFARREKWCLAMEVFSNLEKDCLHKEAFSRQVVLKYLSALKKEYLVTHNYNETVFKN